jgi:hypothetical protein
MVKALIILISHDELMTSLSLLSYQRVASREWDFFDSAVDHDAWPLPSCWPTSPSISMEGRPGGPAGTVAWTIWPASSTQLTVSGTVQYRVVWGINCMCLVIFNTAAPAPDGDHPTSQSGAAARMDQCMHGTDHTCICMHACMPELLDTSLFYSLSSTLTPCLDAPIRRRRHCTEIP